MSDKQGKIRTVDLFPVFLRSLLIQASWSFDRMQSLGFAFAIEPILKRLYRDPEQYRSRVRLHMDYFNTQPYLASFILGAAARIEEERASGSDSAADVAGLKGTLMGPLGALGDSFFWGALKPLTAVIAVAVLLSGVWWAPMLFLALYNVVHIALRVDVLFWGYRSAGDAVGLMARYSFTKMAKVFKAVCLSVTGAIVGMVSGWRPEFKPTIAAPHLITAVAALFITFGLVFFLKKGASPVKLLLGLAVVSIALAYAGAGL